MSVEWQKMSKMFVDTHFTGRLASMNKPRTGLHALK